MASRVYSYVPSIVDLHLIFLDVLSINTEHCLKTETRRRFRIYGR